MHGHTAVQLHEGHPARITPTSEAAHPGVEDGYQNFALYFHLRCSVSFNPAKVWSVSPPLPSLSLPPSPFSVCAFGL